MDSDESRQQIIRQQRYQAHMLQQKLKNNKMIFIIIIIVILLLIGGGIGLYFALKNDNTDNSNNKILTNTTNTTNTTNLPDELKNIFIPECNGNRCIKVGQQLMLNRVISSDSITMTITNNLNMINRQKIYDNQKMLYTLTTQNASPLYTTFNDINNMLTNRILDEEKNLYPYYLIIHNKRTNKYLYTYLNNNQIKLSLDGFIDGDRIVQFTSSKTKINDNNYFIDYYYDPSNNNCLLIDNVGKPYLIINKKDLEKFKVESNIIESIGYVLLTNYSVLIYDNNYMLIGVLTEF